MSSTSSRSLLPEDFVPNAKHVIIGRGKKHSKHTGNLKYGELVHEEMHAYAAAENKAGKSEVISRLVSRVREAGNFVREAGQGRWALVEEHAVRTTTAQHFRDALYNKYRSSKEMKKQKRKEDRRLEGQQPEVGAGHGALVFEEDFALAEPCKKRARCVSPERKDNSTNLSAITFVHKQLLFQQQQQQQQRLDYLSIFNNVFMNSSTDLGSNPFEPTPIQAAAAASCQPDAQSALGAFVNSFSVGATIGQVDSLEHMPFFEVDEHRFNTFQAI